jgi:hypothetical protein
MDAGDYERSVRRALPGQRVIKHFTFVHLKKCDRLREVPPIIFPDCKILFLESNDIEFNRWHVDEITFPAVEGVYIHGSLGAAYSEELFPDTVKWYRTKSSPITLCPHTLISYATFVKIVERAERIGNIDPEHRETMIEHALGLMRRGRSRTTSSPGRRGRGRRGSCHASEHSIVSVAL